MISKPISWNRRAIGVTVGLSESITVIRTTPSSGSPFEAASCDFANADPNESEIPITSPVDRISGPSTGSVPANLLNGNTASFTDTYGGTISSVNPMSSSVSPTMTRAASDASGTPIAFDTNGIVRLARGFTSSTYTTPFLIAYWTLIRPTTPSAWASATVCSRIACRSVSPTRYGGSTHAES